ncbi:S1C family serine protease [Pseudomonadota bacterium]
MRHHGVTITWIVGILSLTFMMSIVVFKAIPPQNQVNAEAMLNASVSIKTVSHVKIDEFGNSVWESQVGSGFMVSNEACEIWTNYHVIADAAIVNVYPRGWTETTGIPAKVVNFSPRTDIAVLRMKNCRNIPAAQLGKSTNLQQGNEIYAVGNPLGDNPDSISRGIISHTKRFLKDTIPYIQTDASINEGNSGGALFNKEGEVIGMNTALALDNKGGNAGIAYAIPIDLVSKTVEQLHKGPPSWGNAGLKQLVNDISPEAAKIFGVNTTEGAIIVTKTPETGPTKDKLLARDVIYVINKNPVTNVAVALRIINQYSPGETVQLQLIRQGNEKTVEISLSEGWNPKEAALADYYEGYLGLTLSMWDGDESKEISITTPVITKIKSLGPAHRSQIASTQHYMARKGRKVLTYPLDVKTITGVVLSGTYHAISSIEQIDRHAARAYVSKSPLLLEIQNWRRASPFTSEQPLELLKTTFHRIIPAPTSAAEPVNKTTLAAVKSDKFPKAHQVRDTSHREWDI